jgi:acyl-[acyl carrier protein]--UDP-N-acetylglucosamine O-acyltransferase
VCTGSALVSGYALIYGYAELCGDTNVYGNAAVFGNARISSQNHIFWATGVGMDNGTLTVYTGPGNSLIATRGCYLGTVEEFLAKSKRVHNKRVHQEYCLLIEVAKSRITA